MKSGSRRRWSHRLPPLWLASWFTAAAVFSFTSPAHQLARSLGGPAAAHPLGFDAFGRDLLATVLRASATSGAFALFAVALSVFLSVAAGAGMALAPPRPRFYLLRLLDFTLAFPSLLLALAWAALRGPGWDTLIASLALGTIPSFTRLIYARARELLREDYVAAARGMGAGSDRILRRHLLPALLSICGIKAPGLFAHALLAEATLSFLGVGAPIGRDTWGSLLAQGKDYLLEAPHLALGVGVPLILTVLALQLGSEKFTERYLRG